MELRHEPNPPELKPSADRDHATAVSDDPYEVRHYRAGDEARIIELFERTFGRTMGPSESARHWEWEFLGNPSGRTAILLAESAGTLAAQYAVMPLGLWMEGRVHDAALSLDTATDSRHRGKGLFPRLANQLYSELAAEGCVAVFGFPNRQSAPSFFQKLGWVELAPFPLLLKPLRGAVGQVLKARGARSRVLSPIGEAMTALMRRGPRPIPSGLSIEEVRQFPPDADDLWERARVGKRIAVVRDLRYLEWRFGGRPENRYRIHIVLEAGRLVGLLVTLIESRASLLNGFVMEALCEESRADVAAALVSLAETVLTRDGAQLLSALMYPGTVARRALRSAGFYMVPHRFFPQEIHFGVRALEAGADPRLLHDPSSWYITWGDTDIL